MKFLLTIAALVAVAAAQPTKRPTPVDNSFEPISVGPAIVDFPIAPSPVVIGPLAPGQPIPLVQIIINVNDGASAPVNPAPVVIPDVKPEPIIEPVQVVDVIPVEPIQVIDVIPVEPVQVIDVIPVEPVQVIDVVPVEPVIVANPVPSVIVH